MVLIIALLIATDIAHDIDGVDTDLLGVVLCGTLAGTVILRIVERQWLRQVLLRASAALVAILLSSSSALAVAEYCTRWMYRDVTSTSDSRGYFSGRWNRSGHVRLNSHGFREREFTEVPSPNVHRIAVVGDSFTFGNGLRAELRFSELIQHSLGPEFEVLNFGVPGYNTPNELDVVRRVVLPLHPEFVLLQWFVNDVEGDSRSRPVYAPLLPFTSLHRSLQRRSALYTISDFWWTRQQIRWGLRQSYPDYINDTYGNQHRAPAGAHHAAIRSLLATVKDAHAGVGIILFPDTGYDLRDRYPFAFLHERVLGICGEAEVRCVDLRPVFAEVKDRQRLWVNRLDAHPSALANSIAAFQIVRAFEAAWLR